MIQRWMLPAMLVVGGLFLTGCSAGDAHTGFNIGKNLARKDTNLRVSLDGQQAKQSKLKKGLMGHAAFKISEPVTCSPKFRYEVIDPKKFGFIKRVSMQVHQKFEADFSDIPEYVITPMTNEDSMKDNTEYDLADLGTGFKIIDRHDNVVEKVEFRPGVDYLLVFTVQADQSETIQIFFKTK